MTDQQKTRASSSPSTRRTTPRSSGAKTTQPISPVSGFASTATHAFEPGQYMTTGVTPTARWCSGRTASRRRRGCRGWLRVLRPARAHHALHDALWRLPIGHRMRMIGPKGRFLLEPDDDRTHLFVSTGTGIAPFISMMRTLLIDGEPRRVVMLNGVLVRARPGLPAAARGVAAQRRVPGTYVPTDLAPRRPGQRRLERPDGPRRERRARRLPRSAAAAREDGRVHLRQPGHDHQRRGAADERGLPGVPRQEGALLAQGAAVPRPTPAEGGAHGRRRPPIAAA